MDTPPSAASAVSAAADLSQKFSDNAGKALALLIDKVTSGIDQATSFMAAQIPDVIHQLLVYNLVVSVIWCAAGFLGIFMFPIIARVLWLKVRGTFPKKHSWQTDQTDMAGIFIMLSVFLSAGSVAVFLTHFDWLEIWLAPKIYLIEYAANLVKTASGH